MNYINGVCEMLQLSVGCSWVTIDSTVVLLLLLQTSDFKWSCCQHAGLVPFPPMQAVGTEIGATGLMICRFQTSDKFSWQRVIYGDVVSVSIHHFITNTVKLQNNWTLKWVGLVMETDLLQIYSKNVKWNHVSCHCVKKAWFYFI